MEVLSSDAILALGQRDREIGPEIQAPSRLLLPNGAVPGEQPPTIRKHRGEIDTVRVDRRPSPRRSTGLTSYLLGACRMSSALLVSIQISRSNEKKVRRGVTCSAEPTPECRPDIPAATNAHSIRVLRTYLLAMVSPWLYRYRFRPKHAHRTTATKITTKRLAGL